MKGVEFRSMSGWTEFPSIAFDSGTIQLEETFRFSKRVIDGTMRLIAPIGAVVKIQCRWAFLTSEQFFKLKSYVSGKFFPVSFVWNGQRQEKNFYAGNISAKPCFLDSQGNPRYYSEVTFSIISKETLK